jgi:uncharacterized membrane protein (DUF4010 family)
VSELAIARNLAVAGLAGLAVGLEREWSGHASGPGARFAGIRTFFLLGLLGGVAGWLTDAVHVAAGLALVLGGVALTVSAYLIAARRSIEAIDGTTEAAALLVLGLGLVAGLGEIQIASGATAVILLILGEKHAIRRFVGAIGPVEMQAALQFAVLALVVLPLVPAGPYGPGGVIRPRQVWGVVLFFSALNFAGYLARRAFGEQRGYPLAGALGGLLSSTAVTLHYSRRSREEPDLSGPLALGTLAACVVLVPRVLVVVGALNFGLLPRALLALGPMLVLGGVLVLLRWRQAPPRSDAPAPEDDRNPLKLWTAIRMAVAFQIVLIGIELARTWFGSAGVVGGAALVGLTDVDALTLSMTRLAADTGSTILAAQALGVGVVVNTLLKTGLTLALGSAEFRRRSAPALLLLAASGALGWWLVTLVRPA